MSAAAPLPISDPPPPLTVVETERLVHRPMAAEVADCACPEFCERDHDQD